MKAHKIHVSPITRAPNIPPYSVAKLLEVIILTSPPNVGRSTAQLIKCCGLYNQFADARKKGDGESFDLWLDKPTFAILLEQLENMQWATVDADLLNPVVAFVKGVQDSKEEDVPVPAEAAASETETREKKKKPL